MNIEMDSDVRRVAEFMQLNIAAAKLSFVAACLAQLAPTLWGHYGEEPVIALRLLADNPTMDCDLRTPTDAI